MRQTMLEKINNLERKIFIKKGDKESNRIGQGRLNQPNLEPVQRLTDQALQYLQNIKNLKELNIENYQFPKTALDELKKALPKCAMINP